MFRGEKIYPRNEEKEAPGGHTSDFNSALVRWRQSGGAHAAADRKTDRRTDRKKNPKTLPCCCVCLRAPVTLTPCVCVCLHTWNVYLKKNKKYWPYSKTWALVICSVIYDQNVICEVTSRPLNHHIIVSSTFKPKMTIVVSLKNPYYAHLPKKWVLASC